MVPGAPTAGHDAAEPNSSRYDNVPEKMEPNSESPKIVFNAVRSLMRRIISPFYDRHRLEARDFFRYACRCNDIHDLLEVFVRERRFFGEPAAATCVDDDTLRL